MDHLVIMKQTSLRHPFKATNFVEKHTGDLVSVLINEWMGVPVTQLVQLWAGYNQDHLSDILSVKRDHCLLYGVYVYVLYTFSLITVHKLEI